MGIRQINRKDGVNLADSRRMLYGSGFSNNLSFLKPFLATPGNKGPHDLI